LLRLAWSLFIPLLRRGGWNSLFNNPIGYLTDALTQRGREVSRRWLRRFIWAWSLILSAFGFAMALCGWAIASLIGSTAIQVVGALAMVFGLCLVLVAAALTVLSPLLGHFMAGWVNDALARSAESISTSVSSRIATATSRDRDWPRGTEEWGRRDF
jgi:hypothetical protein